MSDAPENFPSIENATAEFEARLKSTLNGNVEALERLAENAAHYVSAQDTKTAPFTKIINPAGWEGILVPERQWTVPDYVPDKAVTLLSGDGGQGKSLLALQLAATRALARDWIGLLPEPGRTLVLSAEDDADETHRRLDAIRKFYDVSWADLKDIRLVDLVGEDPLLAMPAKGKIEPSTGFRRSTHVMPLILASLS
jgi:RecA-family ATPase